MELISVLKDLILEYKLVDRFKDYEGNTVDVEATAHSFISQDSRSVLTRVPTDEVLESMTDIRDILVRQSKKILEKCDRYNKECGILVRDNMLKMDYQLWIDETENGKMKLVINTSIRHPRKLFNKEKHNVIVIDEMGSQRIIESFTNIKINNKFIQYYLFD